MMQEAWFEGFDGLVSVGGGVKGGLTKLSGGVVRFGGFDITKQKDGNSSVASERELWLGH